MHIVGNGQGQIRKVNDYAGLDLCREKRSPYLHFGNVKTKYLESFSFGHCPGQINFPNFYRKFCRLSSSANKFPGQNE
jgi:hypothetical protein